MVVDGGVNMISMASTFYMLQVLSGGVASNEYIRQGLADVAEMFDCQIACPPARLCTDNGVMIAW